MFGCGSLRPSPSIVANSSVLDISTLSPERRTTTRNRLVGFRRNQVSVVSPNQQSKCPTRSTEPQASQVSIFELRTLSNSHPRGRHCEICRNWRECGEAEGGTRRNSGNTHLRSPSRNSRFRVRTVWQCIRTALQVCNTGTMKIVTSTPC